MNQPLFFDSWIGLGRVLLAGGLAYIGLVIMIRLSGKRTLTKLNAFDLVVTVALGSTLATVLLSKDVPILEGLLGFAVLIGAQYVITSVSIRSGAFRNVVKSTPRLLVYNGELLHDALEDERVTVEEVYAAVRGSGKASLEQIGAVVLETDASLSVLALDAQRDPVVLRNVRGYHAGTDLADKHQTVPQSR